MPLSEAKLRELVAADEGQYHDRKSLFEGPPGGKRPRDRRAVRDQIAEQVAGFANADGGIVIFGVQDDHSITGHDYPPDVVEQMLLVPQTRLVPPQAAGYRVMLDGLELLVLRSRALRARSWSTAMASRTGSSTRPRSSRRRRSTRSRTRDWR